MNINIMKLSETAIIPKYQTAGAAAFDLHADASYLITHRPTLVRTGLSIAIPENFVGLIMPRSSLGHKKGFMLGNTTGVIDSDYRGEIMVSVRNYLYKQFISQGDRIAQLLILPVIQVQFNEVTSLDETERGEGGFGSTG